MPQWTVPELYCPFAPAVNDRAREAEEETAAWLCRHELAEGRAGTIAAAAARLAARIRPRVSYAALSATADFYAWMFVRDDCCDETAAGLSANGLFREDLGSLAVLDGRAREACGPRERALADVLGRLAALYSGRAWRRNFRRQMRAYFQATFWEAANRARGEVPDLATYTRVRPIAAGVRVDDALLDASLSGAALPPQPAAEPLAAALSGCSGRAVCWSNDLFSLEKELAAGDVHNLVVVLRRERSISTEEAIRRAARMHDREVHQFVELEERLHAERPNVPGWLSEYAGALKHRMRGNLDWTLAAARYGVAVRDEGSR